ncbi:MAG: ABC transporter substrate-binding protein [Streptosporangiales bacterium]|nr:ABC transporter substrate-binding protein [Streptosporangiales bacterium]
MRGISRPVAALAAAVMLVSFTGACGGGADEPADDTFSVGIGEPTHLIPGNCQEGNGIAVISGLFEGLVSLESDGELTYTAASSVTSKDQRVWTVKLRAGRTFHNGEKVTSQSFVDAWNAAAYAPNEWVNNYFFGNIEGYADLNPEKGEPKVKEMSGLEVVDDLTFTVTLDAPFSQFPLTLAYTGFNPLPKAAFDDLEKFDRAPIGNGPFRMDGTWQHNKTVKLKAYSGYKGTHEPVAGGVEFRIYTKPETAYNDLVAGNLDIYDEIPPSSLRRAEQDLDGRFFTAPSSSFHYLGFPIYDKRFANPDLRHAIAMAIDRKAIVDSIYNGSYRPADSLISPIVPGYRKGACGEWCTFDPVKAKQLLAKAGGWKGPMTLWLPTDEGYDEEMQAIVNQLRKNLGIEEITFKQQVQAQYLDVLRAHDVTGPYRLDWGMDYPSPQNYLEPLYSSKGSSNRIGYSHESVDALIEQGNRASSIEAGVEFYNRAEDQVLKDMPVAPLYFGQIQAGYSEHVSDVKEDALVGIHLWDVTVTG